MIRTQFVSVSLAIVCAMPSVAAGQDRALTVRPESKVTFEGSSNVHDWACRTNAFEATIAVDSSFERGSLSALAKPISRLSVRIPVRSLRCGHNRMNENLYKTLRATEFPDIKYQLASFTVSAASTNAARFAAAAIGDITVAGVTKRVEVPITAERWEGGARGKGTVRLLMTDFGVKPPVALLGTLRTRNEIEVTFEVLLDKAVVVALTRTAARPALD